MVKLTCHYDVFVVVFMLQKVSHYIHIYVVFMLHNVITLHTYLCCIFV